MADAIRLDRVEVHTFEEDVLFTEYPAYPREAR
jgi:hypothetical protein